MIIYSVTVTLEPEIELEWLNWMKEKHIPDIMSTGCFIEKKLTKIIQGLDNESINYNIQYVCSSERELQEYQKNHAPLLQKEHNLKFTDKFIAFRTLLKVIE